RPYLDPRLDAILLRATCPEPQGRYRSASEFSDALAALTPSAPPLALTAPEPAVPQPARPTPTLAAAHGAPWWQRPDALIAAALLALAGACVVAGLMNHNDGAYAITFILLAVAGGVLALGAAVRWWRQLGLTSKNRAGETWLMAAAKRGQIGRVKDLLARGAEGGEKGREGQTALMKAAAEGHAAVGRALL